MTPTYSFQGCSGLVLLKRHAVRKQQIELFTSQVLIDELVTTLSRSKFQKYASQTGQSLTEVIETYVAFSTLVEAAAIPSGVVRDPKDEMVLACAVGGEVDCIVSGDQDLLVLHDYVGIPIWTVSHLLSQIDDS